GPEAPLLSGVTEHPGAGLEWNGWKLGSCAFTGQAEDGTTDHVLWLTGPGGERQRFQFADRLRPDAEAVVARLKAMNIGVEILSGDRPAPVEDLAYRLGIATYHARMRPADKVARLEALRNEGRKVLMVGDGINDAAALSSAHVSVAPASGTEITQSAADVVFQGERLEAIPTTILVARRADRLVRQNLAIALLYNISAVPLA